MSEAERQEALPKAHYTINTTFRVTADIIKKASSLKMIQRTGVGINNVDVECADELGIPVAIVPRGNGVAVAEFEVLQDTGAITAHLRELEADTKAGEWPNFKYRDVSYEMDGKTIGFIGFGYIAREIAKRVRGFNCRIIYFDLYRASEEVEKEYDATYMPRDEVPQAVRHTVHHGSAGAENRKHDLHEGDENDEEQRHNRKLRQGISDK